jgi:hypothetical protein
VKALFGLRRNGGILCVVIRKIGRLYIKIASLFASQRIQTGLPDSVVKNSLLGNLGNGFLAA